MKTPFDEWLAQLRRAGKGPVAISIDRGLPYRWQFALEGNWSGSQIKAALRLYPDAASILAAFSVFGPTYMGEVDATLFALTMTAGQTAALPADGDGDALATFSFDVLFTPVNSIQHRLFGGAATITGKVTDAS